MTITLFLAGIIAPAILWMLYFRYKDSFKPEPFVSILATFAMGFVSGWLCHKAFSLLPLIGLPEDPSIIMDQDRIKFLWYCLGPVGLLEELAKFLPFLIVIFLMHDFDELIDGIVYACIISLGFAAYENFFYLQFLEGFELMGRAIASPLTHGIFSSIWGFFVGKARLEKKPILLLACASIAIAALIHGLFDFFTTSPTLRLLSSLIILVFWLARIWGMDRLNRRNRAQTTPQPER